MPHYTLLQPNDSMWKRLLDEVVHDFYHLGEYSEIVAQLEGAQARALHIQEGDNIVVVPLIVRSLPPDIDLEGTFLDAVSPYGYSSPLICCKSPDFLRKLPSLIQDAAREFNLVSIFLRWHPFISEQYQQLAKGAQTGSVVWLDLSRSLALSYSSIRTAHRRSIQRLQRLGYSTRTIEGRHVDTMVLDRFLHLYYQTMTRVQARPYYFFPRSYFINFFRLLAPSTQVLEVLSPDGEVVSSLILVTYGEFAHYHLSGTESNALDLSPLKLGIWKAVELSQSLGCSLLCLGGGVGAKQDNLFQFKQGFSGLLKPFYTDGLVCSPHYEELNLKAQIIQGSPSDSSYFPKYRASRSPNLPPMRHTSQLEEP